MVRSKSEFKSIIIERFQEKEDEANFHYEFRPSVMFCRARRL